MGKRNSFNLERREKIIEKIFECQRYGGVNVHQVANNSSFSEREISAVCEYLVTRGVLRANRIGTRVTISYTILKNYF